MEKQAAVNQAITIVAFLLMAGLIILIRWSMWVEKRQQRRFPAAQNPAPSNEDSPAAEAPKASEAPAAPAQSQGARVGVQVVPRKSDSIVHSVIGAIINRYFDVTVPVDEEEPKQGAVLADERSQAAPNERKNEGSSPAGSENVANAGAFASSPESAAINEANAAGITSLHLNHIEQAALAKMIAYKQIKPNATKEDTIWMGFEKRKGGGPAYTRASEIYDMFFGSAAVQPRFRQQVDQLKVMTRPSKPKEPVENT